MAIIKQDDFIESVASPWHSDHLCFGVVGGRVLHDLLPLAAAA